MWLSVVVVVLLVVGLLALGHWTGLRSCTSTLAAAESTLSAAQAVQQASQQSLAQANLQANLAAKFAAIETLVQQQTDSGEKALTELARMEAEIYALTEQLASRGIVRTMPRQAGEGPRVRTVPASTNPPPPLPASAMPSAKPIPGTTQSSEQPTATG